MVKKTFIRFLALFLFCYGCFFLGCSGAPKKSSKTHKTYHRSLTSSFCEAETQQKIYQILQHPVRLTSDAESPPEISLEQLQKMECKAHIYWRPWDQLWPKPLLNASNKSIALNASMNQFQECRQWDQMTCTHQEHQWVFERNLFPEDHQRKIWNEAFWEWYEFYDYRWMTTEAEALQKISQIFEQNFLKNAPHVFRVQQAYAFLNQTRGQATTAAESRPELQMNIHTWFRPLNQKRFEETLRARAQTAPVKVQSYPALEPDS